MVFVFLIVLFIAALFVYSSNLISYIIWLAICAGLYFFNPVIAFIAFIFYGVAGGIHSGSFSGGEYSGTGSSGGYSRSSSGSSFDVGRLWADKVYGDGSYRTEGFFDGTYRYSDGTTSYTSAWTGNEIRSNGETVIDNAFLPGRKDIYKDGRRIGYEYDDWRGVTQRVDEE